MAITNLYGGVPGGMSSVRDPMGLPGVMPMAGSLYGGGGSALGGVAIPTAMDANAANLAYTRGAIAGDPTYKIAQGFLNPNDPTAMRDVAMHGAENAVGRGTVGSGVSGQYTGRLRQYDIERRAALGNQLLSGAYGRTPQPVDPYAASRLNMEANAENNRLISSIQNRYAPSGGFSQGYNGGGGRSAPMVIGGGGGGNGVVTSPAGRLSVTGGGTPAGSDQIAGGYFGPTFNANQQRSQFGPSNEFAPGTMYAGPNNGATDYVDTDYGNNWGPDLWLDE